MRILVLSVAVAVLAIGLLGCQQAQQTTEKAAEETAETVAETVTDTMASMAVIDPVCGMEVSKDTEWTAEYDGATFYFCSESCRDKFVEDPGTYLKEMGKEVMDN